MKNKIRILLYFFLVCSILGGCNSKNNLPNTDEFHSTSCPNEFTWEGRTYIWREYVKEGFTKHIGYFINTADLEKWKAMDQDESMIYITHEKGVLYNYDNTGQFSNRFLVYESDVYGTKVLGIKSHSNFQIKMFELKEGVIPDNMPSEFTWEGRTYIKDGYDITGDFKQGSIGCLINEEDLDKWKAMDQIEDWIYIIYTNGSLYNYDPTGTLSNRFLVFESTIYGTKVLGLKPRSIFRITVYKIKECK